MTKVKNSQFMVAMLALSLAAVSGYAQSQPSAKVTAKTANLTLLPSTTGDGTWQTLLSNTIKTANQKDLFNAASFNFVAVDVPQGVHTISVQARIDTDATFQTGSASAEALVGKGSMTVESVRLIKDPNVILDL